MKAKDFIPFQFKKKNTFFSKNVLVQGFFFKLDTRNMRETLG